MDDFAARPNRIPWPPLIFVAAALGAVGLGYVVPAGLGAPWWLRWAGVGVMLGGIGLDLAASFAMWRGRANILPHRAATALVTGGPFAISRNPIYLGNTTILLGAGLAFDTLWPIMAAGLAAGAVTRLAILREEAHLAAKFGAAWTDYAGRVPRWILFR